MSSLRETSTSPTARGTPRTTSTSSRRTWHTPRTPRSRRPSTGRRRPTSTTCRRRRARRSLRQLHADDIKLSMRDEYGDITGLNAHEERAEDRGAPPAERADEGADHDARAPDRRAARGARQLGAARAVHARAGGAQRAAPADRPARSRALAAPRREGGARARVQPDPRPRAPDPGAARAAARDGERRRGLPLGARGVAPPRRPTRRASRRPRLRAAAAAAAAAADRGAGGRARGVQGDRGAGGAARPADGAAEGGDRHVDDDDHRPRDGGARRGERAHATLLESMEAVRRAPGAQFGARSALSGAIRRTSDAPFRFAARDRELDAQVEQRVPEAGTTRCSARRGGARPPRGRDRAAAQPDRPGQPRPRRTAEVNQQLRQV